MERELEAIANYLREWTTEEERDRLTRTVYSELCGCLFSWNVHLRRYTEQADTAVSRWLDASNIRDEEERQCLLLVRILFALLRQEKAEYSPCLPLSGECHRR